MSVKGVVSAIVAADKCHSGSHYLSSALYTPSKITMRFKFANEQNISIQISILCE